MQILVTNDDGIHSPGLLPLVDAVAGLGHEVMVVAPLDDRSGSGAAIGPVHLADRVDGTRVRLRDLDDDVDAWAIDGPPGLAVLTACLGAYGRAPDVIVAGINPGNNTGRAVLHSGTVGAALTATNFGRPGLAVSLGLGDHMHWETAAAVGRCATRWIVERMFPTVLNVNVPNVAFDRLLGVRVAHLAPFGTVRSAFEALDAHLRVELRTVADRLDRESDTALVMAGYVAVTELAGVHAVGGIGTHDAVDFVERALGSRLAAVH